jgi:response regulator RpfG family c-di-GMP phosphodiesterase
VKKLDEL